MWKAKPRMKPKPWHWLVLSLHSTRSTKMAPIKGAKYQFRCGDQQTRKLRISFAFHRRLSLLYLSIKSWKTFFALRHQQDYCGRATSLRATFPPRPTEQKTAGANVELTKQNLQSHKKLTTWLDLDKMVSHDWQKCFYFAEALRFTFYSRNNQCESWFVLKSLIR